MIYCCFPVLKQPFAGLQAKACALCRQEADRPAPRQAELQPSRAPLQTQSNNVPPAVAPAATTEVSNKPLPYLGGLGSSKLPLAHTLSHAQVG